MEKGCYDAQGRLNRFRTKQGKRVLVSRQHDTRNGTRFYRDYFTYQVKRDGKRYYFPLSGEKSEAAKLADQIAAFLAIRTNGIKDAIATFAPDRLEKTESAATHTPTVGELIDTYQTVANRVSERTKIECAGALRRISGFILGLTPCQNSMGKEAREIWRKKVEALNVSKITPGELEGFRGSLIRKAGSNHRFEPCIAHHLRQHVPSRRLISSRNKLLP